MDADQLSFLYKSLVILPQDKTTTAETLNKTSTSEDEKSKEISSEQKNKDDKIDTNTVVEEPAGTYKKTQIPFTIFTTEKLQKEYLQEGSSFIKIINAIQLPKLASHIEVKKESMTAGLQYDCIWCIGLDIATEKNVRSINHPNVLFSPDINSLKSNEEKKKMFTGLKEFINSNKEITASL